MMEEELRQEAEGYFETSCPYSYADTEDDLKHDVTEAYMAGAEPREKRIKELEKENAELKENFRICEKNADTYFDNLTEAKKVIEELYNIIPASMSDYAKEPMEHARKFMTEE